MSDLLSLKSELKIFIVRRLRLTDISPESIGDTDPLLEGILGLDSVDVLDLVVGIEKEYGLHIPNMEEGRLILSSIDSLARRLLRKGSEG